MTFPGAVQASDSPPMPRLSLVEQVQGEGCGHCGGHYRTGEYDDLGEDVGDDVGEEDGNSRTGVMRLWHSTINPCLFVGRFPQDVSDTFFFLLSSTQ